MIKAALSLGLLCIVSAQDLQNIADKINAAAGNAGNGVVQASQNGNSFSLLVGEYDWILSENNEGDFDLEVVDSGNANSEDLAVALAGLLDSVNSGAQDNSNAIGDALNNAEQAGVVVQGDQSAALNNAAAAYGDQLQSNPAQLSTEAADLYQQTAAALASNENGLNDQVNEAINNAAQQNNVNGLNDLAANAESASVVANTLAENLPETVPANQDEAVESALLALGNLPPEQLNDAIASAESAAASLPADVANAAGNAAENAGIDLLAAADSANAAADQAGVDLQANLDSANSAANNAAGAAQSAAQDAAANAILNGNV